MKGIIAYAIVKKTNPKISIMHIYSSYQKKEIALDRDEKWIAVLIKPKK